MGLRNLIIASVLLLVLSATAASAQQCLDEWDDPIPVCDEPQRDVYFLVDVSSSLNQATVDTVTKQYLRKVFCLFFSTGDDAPRIGLGIFNGNFIQNVINLQSFASIDDWVAAVDDLYATGKMQTVGNTPMAESINLARAVFQQSGSTVAGRKKHLILITDGEPNPLVGVPVNPGLPIIQTTVPIPIVDSRVVFDFYNPTTTPRTSNIVCGSVINRASPPPSASIPILKAGCSITTMENYLFKALPKEGSQIKTNFNVRISAVHLPKSSGVFGDLSLLKGEFNNLTKCAGRPGYNGGASYCRFITEGVCACGIPPSPIVSTPVSENIFRAELTVDALVNATQQILCPLTF